MLEHMREKVALLNSRWLIGIFAILIVPFFPPEIINHVGTSLFVDAYAWGGVISAVACASLYVLLARKDVFSLLGVILPAIVLLSTLFYGGAINLWFSKWLPCFAVVMLVAAFGRSMKRELLWGLFVVTFTLSVLNLASALLFPEGVYATNGTAQSGNFFYGNKDSAYRILFPALCSSFVLDACCGRWLSVRSLLVLAVSILTVYLATSSATLLALTFLVVLVLCARWEALRRYLNGLTVTIMGVAGFLAIVVFRLQHLFDFIIVDALGKSLTFTGRTFIWDKVFELQGIRCFFIGRGVSGYRELWVNDRQYYHAHDGFLDIWLNSGMLGVLVLCAMLGLAAFVLYRFRARQEAAVYAAVLGAYYLNGITEPVFSVSFIAVLALAYYSFTGDKRCVSFRGIKNEKDEGNGCPGLRS